MYGWRVDGFSIVFAPLLVGVVVWMIVAGLTGNGLLGLVVAVVAALALGWKMLTTDT